MNSKTIFLIISSLIFVFGFLFIVYKFTNTSADYSAITVVKSNDHVKWSTEKKHILVEYSDLQCPACKAFNEILNSFETTSSVNGDIPKKITLVFRHFPLYQVHENAFEMAYGAEAATIQGKFFPLVDTIFKNQAVLENTRDAKGFLFDKAKNIGINVEQLNRDMNSKPVKDKVDADLAQGEKANITGTPTFFLDGKMLEFQTPQEFIQILKKL